MKQPIALPVLVAVLLAASAASAQDSSPPTKATSFTVLSVERTTATLQWKAPYEDTQIIVDPIVVATAAGPSPSPSPSPAPKCTSYDIRYSTSPIAGVADWDAALQVTGEPVPVAPNTLQQHQVTGLQANQLYYFAIKAADEAGNVGPMALTSGTTSADAAAPDAVAGLAVVSTTATSITLTWTAPADDDGSKVSFYDLRYSGSSVTGGEWNGATPVTGEPLPQAPGAFETMTFEILDGGSYHVAVVAYDAAGNSAPPSSEVLVTIGGQPDTDGDGGSSSCGGSASAAGAAGLLLLIAALRLRAA